MFTKQDLADMALGRRIRENPTKVFVIATPDGVYAFYPKCTKDDGKLKGIEASMWCIDDHLSSKQKDKWADYTDEQLRDLEQSLYDDEVSGEDAWFERDQVLNEMNRRGMMG